MSNFTELLTMAKVPFVASWRGYPKWFSTLFILSSALVLNLAYFTYATYGFWVGAGAWAASSLALHGPLLVYMLRRPDMVANVAAEALKAIGAASADTDELDIEDPTDAWLESVHADMASLDETRDRLYASAADPNEIAKLTGELDAKREALAARLARLRSFIKPES